MKKERDRDADGFIRRVRTYALGNFAPLWALVARIDFIARFANRFIINAAATSSRNRPHPYSTLHEYTSWDSLTDKQYYSRHLKASQDTTQQPDSAELAKLFTRPADGGINCEKSTLLFPVFAQYLTDGFLRTNMDNRELTTSNHDIDLSQFYGRAPKQTRALRLLDETPGNKGKMRSQVINDGEYPEYLFEDDGKTIRAQFLDTSGQPILDRPLGLDKIKGKAAERKIFAVGGDRANATPLITLMNTLMLREHNRIATHLESNNPDWDDERVFQVSRNILIAIYIKIVIEEYINHISSACFRLSADPKVTWKAQWNRPNWMTVEFALLYRWHSLVPDSVHWDGKNVPSGKMVLDNRFAVEAGLAKGFSDISSNKATKISLFNTPEFLLAVEERAIQQARELRIPKFNDYREHFGMPRITRFEQMTSNPDKLKTLKETYKTPDQVEFYTGLFAEDPNPNTPMPPVVGVMVAFDAFTQALTNPLLSKHAFNADTFTKWGMKEIEKTGSINDLVQRNSKNGGTPSGTDQIAMTQSGWKRSRVPF